MNDLSSLIFVALALAWAVYLIPKAYKAHDEAKRSRSIDKFSATMRVLARREPVSRREARLVVTPARAATRPTVAVKNAVAAARPKAQRPTMSAAQRRRYVLGALSFLNLAFVALATAQVFSWWFMTIPVVLLAAWLVTCRVMVKAERRRPQARPVSRPGMRTTPVTSDLPAVIVAEAEREESPVAEPVATEPGLWDPVQVPLPTYVAKQSAPRRSVRTISIDDSDVWSSGRSDVDSALARGADVAEAAAKARAREAVRRAFGS